MRHLRAVPFASIAVLGIFSGLTGCLDFGSNQDEKAQVELKQLQSSSEFKQHLMQPYVTLRLAPDNHYPEYTETESIDAVADSSSGAKTESFSGTNLQVQGVDEADIWKYDSEVFFVLSPASWEYQNQLTAECSEGSDCGSQWSQVPGSIRIVKNTKETLATIDLGEQSGSDLYLNGDQLIMVNQGQSYYGFMDMMIEPYYGFADSKARIRTWDVSNKQEPDAFSDIEFDGYIQQTRRIGDEIYVISRFAPRIDGLIYSPYNEDDVVNNVAILNTVPASELLPKIRINGVEQPLVEAKNCLATQLPQNYWYSQSITTISKLNTKTNTVTSRCMTGPADGMYMSENNVYLYTNTYADYDASDVSFNTTEGSSHIHQFSLETDGFDYKGSAIIPGLSSYDDANFRYGELSDGSLGVVTSSNDWQDPKHFLTILKTDGSKLDIVSQLPNAQRPAEIGKPGERIYSVRFMQNRAYIVTFQKVDPLYSIDLTNPADPKIAGELEIPGYSDYLHPVGDDLLIGIGKSAITGASGTTWYQGIKVALFDVSDMNNPSELDVIEIGKRGSNTALSSDHHAFSGLQVDDQYRFSFPISVNDGLASGSYWSDPESQFYEWSHSGLHLFEIQNKRLVSAGAVITDSNEGDQNWISWGTRRGLIQGDSIYHLSGENIYQANWNNPSEVSEHF